MREEPAEAAHRIVTAVLREAVLAEPGPKGDAALGELSRRSFSEARMRSKAQWEAFVRQMRVVYEDVQVEMEGLAIDEGEGPVACGWDARRVNGARAVPPRSRLVGD